MRKIKISLPAAATNLGPGLGTLGLALGLRVVVEMTERRDQQLVVETEGEGAGYYSTGLQHPVVLAMIRLFQAQERASLGITIRIVNPIPLNSGLGVEAAFLVAGIIGANNLLGNPYSRDQLLQFAAQFSPRPDGVLATLLGGLTSGILQNDTLLYHSLPVTPLKVVVVLPEADQYQASIEQAVPQRVSLESAVYNLQRIPLLIEGLRTGNLSLIGKVMDDHLQMPFLTAHIPGYSHVLEIARRAGITALTISGNGPALLAFTESRHEVLAEALVAAFTNAGVEARAWVLPIDTQGVVISAVQSA